VYAPNWTHPFDYQWHALAFRVNGEESPGKLAPPHRWRLR
jgi:hypothetical protein